MDISQDRFNDADKAREYLEAQRWPDGPVCHHCGSMRATALKGGKHRAGLYQCNDCREQFTVTLGTVMEDSKIPLNKWMLAIHLLGTSKKGVSSHQLHRILHITYQSAWFLTHRIREAMREEGTEPLGGTGKVVEADETYFGHKKDRRPVRKNPTKGGRSGPAGKRAVLALVERGGSVRSFHIARADQKTVLGIVHDNVVRETRLHTDDSKLYGNQSEVFASHDTVRHSAYEYVRGDVHTNTIEGYFSIFKRGMKGIYQHCSEKHLHRYLAEFDFRYNNRIRVGINDTDRVNKIIKKTAGKRLTYRRPDNAQVTN
jgi:transposase-like protein